MAAYYDDIKAFQALYLYSSEDDMWKVLDGEIGNEFLKAQQLKDNGLEGLCWVSGGSRNFYNNVRPITSPEDLAGLTLRVNTDSMFAFLESCGAKGVNVSYNDIYNSIEAGTIDGAENNWPSYISTGHYKVAPYITVDEHTRRKHVSALIIDHFTLISIRGYSKYIIVAVFHTVAHVIHHAIFKKIFFEYAMFMRSSTE